MYRSSSASSPDGTKWSPWISLGRLSRWLKPEQILLNGLSSKKRRWHDNIYQIISVSFSFYIYWFFSHESLLISYCFSQSVWLGRFIYAAATADVSRRGASTYDGMERRFRRDGSVGVGGKEICATAGRGVGAFLQLGLLRLLMSVLDGM